MRFDNQVLDEHDFLRGLYVCRSHRRQRHLRSSPLVLLPVFLSISIAPLPAPFRIFYLLHAFAEEFTSVVCDPGHRVSHPLIKDVPPMCCLPHGYVFSSCRERADDHDLFHLCAKHIDWTAKKTINSTQHISIYVIIKFRIAFFFFARIFRQIFDCRIKKLQKKTHQQKIFRI